MTVDINAIMNMALVSESNSILCQHCYSKAETNIEVMGAAIQDIRLPFSLDMLAESIHHHLRKHHVG